MTTHDTKAPERFEPEGVDDRGCGSSAYMAFDEMGEWVRYEDYAALQARLDAARMVKPLEWEDHPDKSHAVAIGWVWECCAGTEWNLYTRQLSHTVSYPHGSFGDGSLAAAKSAAQADYERRILSALADQPEGE